MAIKVSGLSFESGSRRIGGTLAEINIIPLVDVTLVLLLIFMLTAPSCTAGSTWNLPKTSGKPTTVEERMVLTISKDQSATQRQAHPGGVARAGALRDMFKNRQDKTIYLRADQALQYGFVVETMDRVRRSGIEKLGMVTEPTRTR